MAAVLGDEARECRCYAIQHAFAVDVDHGIPFVDVHLRYGTDRHQAGVVDHNVQAMVGDDGVDDGEHLCSVRHVHGIGRSKSTFADDRFDQLLKLVFAPCGDRDARAPATSSWAITAPMPLLAPVMRTIFPSMPWLISIVPFDMVWWSRPSGSNHAE